MLKTYLALGGLLLASSTVSGQTADATPQAPIKIARNVHGIFIGADPNNAYERFCQLFDQDLQLHLQLPTEMRQIVYRFAVNLESEWKDAVDKQRSGEVPPGTAEAVMEENRAQAVSLLNELLTPAQQRQLTQWIYRTEAKRIGLGQALVAGRLGLAVGVHENQKTNLEDKAVSIERELQARIAELRAAAEAKLLQELSPEQRERAKDLLGKDFEKQDLTREQKIYQSFRQRLKEDPSFLPLNRTASK